MADELYYDTGGKYGDVIILDKYNDEYFLVAGHKAKEGDQAFMNWGYPQDKDRQPRAKSVPWKIRIGPRQAVVNFIRWMSGQVDDGPVDVPEDSQIPF